MPEMIMRLIPSNPKDILKTMLAMTLTVQAAEAF